jgi:hypothetical protein
MEAVLTIPIPHFFVLFEEEYIGNELTVYDKDPETSVSLYTVNPFQIPPVNEKGWAQFALTSYMTDRNEKTIDISSILNGGGNITQVIDYSIKMGLDPRMFIDTRVYLSQQFDQARCVDIRVDYGKKIICLENPVDEELMLNLVFYADMKYVNESIITMNNINDTRIKNQHKD